MSKKTIIGMAALGIGAAIIGGVGGHYISQVCKPKPPITQVTPGDASFKDYDLPDEFAYISYTAYDVGEKFALLSSSSLGTYLLDKEANKTTFFDTSYISTYSQEINGKTYFWLSNKILFSLEKNTGVRENISLGTGISFDSLSFIGNNGNTLFLKGYPTGSKYYFFTYNIDEEKSTVFELTNNQYSYANVCIELGNFYLLTYSETNSSSTSRDMLVVDKTSGEISTISSHVLSQPFDSGSYFYDEETTKLYGVFKNGSSNYFGVANLSEPSAGVTKVLSSSVYLSYSGSYYKIQKQANGVMFMVVGSKSVGSAPTSYATYVSAEGVATRLTYNNSTSISCFEVDGKNIFGLETVSNGSDRFAKLATFNEETMTFDIIYTEPVGDSNPHGCVVVEIDGQMYVRSGSSSSYKYAKMTNTDDGFEFTNITLTGSTSGKRFEIGEGKFIFIEQASYYDFKNDVYKKLISGNSISIVDITMEKDIVTIYASNNVKYEFNTKTMAFKAVAYWE